MHVVLCMCMCVYVGERDEERETTKSLISIVPFFFLFSTHVFTFLFALSEF